jgi:hypothetical protein
MRIWLFSFVFLLSLPFPARAQVAPEASGGGNQDEPMQMPNLETGTPYAAGTGSESRSNVLNGSVGFTPAYDDNLYPGFGSTPISEMSYSITPKIAFDQTVSRLHETFSYSPSFTIYQQTSGLNALDHTASAKFDYRWTPHVTVSAMDAFQKTSNVFNQAGSLESGSVGGSLPVSPADVIAPWVDRLSNAVTGNLGYQFSANAMIGGGGGSNLMKVPNYGSSGGYDSNGQVASAFLNRRLTLAQTVGVNYQYTRNVATYTTGTFEVQVHGFMPFYSFAPGEHFSASIAAGPQYYAETVTSSVASVPTTNAWTPAVTASFGWQVERSSVAVSLSRTVSGGGGLLGAYIGESASLHARHQFARTWTIDVGGDYGNYKNSAPQSLLTYPGGHTIDGEISLDHPIGEHLHSTIGYQRLHRTYSGSTALTFDPDADRAYVTVSYQFSRPIGR